MLPGSSAAANVACFEKLPVYTLADAEQEGRREAFTALIAKLPEAVRGTAPDLLFEIVEDWMHAAAAKQLSALHKLCDAEQPDAVLAARMDAFLFEQLQAFTAAFHQARGIIRAVLAALRSADPNAKRYVTRVIKAADKRTLLYSSGSGEQTDAQPWLPSPDHVLVAALAETHADTPEQHRDAANRVRDVVLMLAGVTSAVADDGTSLTDAEKVYAARARLADVRIAERRVPRGARPTMDESWRIARAVVEYRVQQELPFAMHNEADGALWPTTDTTALAVAVARAWGVKVCPKMLGRRLRSYLARTMAYPEHAQRADAEHIDWYNLGFEPPA